MSGEGCRTRWVLQMRIFECTWLQLHNRRGALGKGPKGPMWLHAPTMLVV